MKEKNMTLWKIARKQYKQEDKISVSFVHNYTIKTGFLCGIGDIAATVLVDDKLYHIVPHELIGVENG